MTHDEAIRWLAEQSFTHSDSIAQISLSICQLGIRVADGEPQELALVSSIERLEAMIALSSEHRAATRAAFGLPPVPAPPNSSGQ